MGNENSKPTAKSAAASYFRSAKRCRTTPTNEHPDGAECPAHLARQAKSMKRAADCRNTMTQLRRAVNSINTYTDDEECIQFLETMVQEKACMIISDALGEHVVPRVHNMSQVDSIFIFCSTKKYHEGWAKEWPKIKGVFTEIGSICEALKETAQQM